MRILTLTDLHLQAVHTQHIGPIDLHVAGGECVIIMGESGCGKTLLLRAIADLDDSEGQIHLGDTLKSTLSAPQWRQQVALLFSQSYWWLEPVAAHFSNDIDTTWLTQLGLNPNILDKSVQILSSGECQRLALLRVLANYPQVLLLDEPTANLDAKNTQRVEGLIKHYLREYQAAVLWVSHDHEQIERIATRAYQLEGGQLMEKLNGQS